MTPRAWLLITLAYGSVACQSNQANESPTTVSNTPLQPDLPPPSPPQPPTSRTTAPDPPPGPADQEAPPEEPIVADSAPLPEPVVERSGAHAVIAYDGDLDEDPVALLDGVAFAAGSGVWAYSDRTRLVSELARSVDPHQLETDGEWLYWLGFEENGRIELKTGRELFLPRLGASSDQLALGDCLYATTTSHELWQFCSLHLRQIRFGTDGEILALRGLEAGQAAVFTMALLRNRTGPIERVTLRIRADGKSSTIPFFVQSRHWDASTSGGLVFAVEATGAVMRWGNRAAKQKPLFEEPGINAVCWCGRDVCTVNDDHALRRYRGGKAPAEVVETSAGPVALLDCNANYVTWTTPPDESGVTRIHVLALP